MIIFSGLGFLVLLIGFGSAFLTEFCVERQFGDEQYYQEHGWPKFMAFMIAAILVHALGWFLNVKGARQLVDPETQEVVILKRGHSFFFIPMHYWGYILAALAVVMLFVKK